MHELSVLSDFFDLFIIFTFLLSFIIPKQMVQQKAVQENMGQLRTIEDWIGGEAQM